VTPDIPVEVPFADKVTFLGAAENQRLERPQQVETVETHMSCVFLTDRFAYKLKKPVSTR
jgi:aminoglycoside phosphotransferase family enzyme